MKAIGLLISLMAWEIINIIMGMNIMVDSSLVRGVAKVDKFIIMEISMQEVG